MAHNIITYGAVGDGVTDCTRSIQSAIDACADAGGGWVSFPPGRFTSGTLRLRSGVCLLFSGGSQLVARDSLDAFPSTEPKRKGNYNFFMRHALIYAEGAENIGISGQGTIDGSGAAQSFRQTTWQVPDRYQNRPSIIRLVDCRNVRVEQLQIRDSAFWTLHLMACRDVVVRGITIHSRSPNFNTDGIDIDSCENVRISDCSIDTQDDAISIKGTTELPCHRVLVNNCLLSSHCNAIRIGAENFCSFDDISFSNCQIYDSGAGVTMQNIDGFPMRRIAFSNLSLRGVAVPFHAITHRKTYPVGVPESEYPISHGPAPASISDLVIDGLFGRDIGHYSGIGPIHQPAKSDAWIPCSMSGHALAPLLRLTMRNVDLQFIGGGKLDDPKRGLGAINENPNPAPGQYPAFALLLHRVESARLSDIVLRIAADDQRPAIVAAHCGNIELFNVLTEGPQDGAALRHHDVRRLSMPHSYVDFGGQLAPLNERSEEFEIG